MPEIPCEPSDESRNCWFENTDGGVGRVEPTDVHHVGVDGARGGGAVAVRSGELVAVGLGRGTTAKGEAPGLTSVSEEPVSKVDGEALRGGTVGHGTGHSSPFCWSVRLTEPVARFGNVLGEVALERVHLAGVLLVVGEALCVLVAQAVHVSIDLGPVDLVGACNGERGALGDVDVDAALLLLDGAAVARAEAAMRPATKESLSCMVKVRSGEGRGV